MDNHDLDAATANEKTTAATNAAEHATRIDKKQYPCKNCGGAMEFLPGTRNLKCPYCGLENEIPDPAKNPDGSNSDAPARLVELDYLEYLQRVEKEKNKQQKIQITECSGCGARITLDNNISAATCPYCSLPIVVQDYLQDAIAVQGVLPFVIKKERAYQLFNQWLKTLWFAPNNLTALAMRDGVLNGVYTPYWTFDSQTLTKYSGERGEYYYVAETYTRSDGSRATRQVQKIRWYPASGQVKVVFDDVLIPATRSLPAPLINELEPWQLRAVVDFKAEFLSGYRAETYQIGLRDGFVLAQGVMEPVIKQSVLKDIGGDTQRIYDLKTAHNNISFKHILLPIWISAYRYHERTFRFVINGQTGEVQGERPYSTAKIVIFILVLLIVAIGALKLLGVFDAGDWDFSGLQNALQ